MTHSTANVFKLTAAAGIRKALSGVVEAKRNITISALFHGMVNSNVAWATDMQRSDAADFKVESEPGKKDGVTAEQAANNERILKRIAEILNKFATYNVTIVGHANRMTADEREETQDNPAWGRGLTPLSKERAEYVKNYLVKHGIKADRLTTDGKGGTEPVANPKDENNRWKNRRVEFILNK